LYSFEDSNGYLRLFIEKRRRNLKALYTFNLLSEGYLLLRNLVSEFELCPRLCFLQSANISCQSFVDNKCKGACEQKESAEDYNKRVAACIDHLQTNLPTFALLDNGLEQENKSCILVEKGKFYGMGYLPYDIPINGVDELKNYLTPYTENDYIRGIVFQYAERHPYKKISLSIG
jgi:DNA polymerase-3 subunit epsilon